MSKNRQTRCLESVENHGSKVKKKYIDKDNLATCWSISQQIYQNEEVQRRGSMGSLVCNLLNLAYAFLAPWS